MTNSNNNKYTVMYSNTLWHNFLTALFACLWVKILRLWCSLKRLDRSSGHFPEPVPGQKTEVWITDMMMSRHFQLLLEKCRVMSKQQSGHQFQGEWGKTKWRTNMVVKHSWQWIWGVFGSCYEAFVVIRRDLDSIRSEAVAVSLSSLLCMKKNSFREKSETVLTLDTWLSELGDVNN